MKGLEIVVVQLYACDGKTLYFTFNNLSFVFYSLYGPATPTCS